MLNNTFLHSFQKTFYYSSCQTLYKKQKMESIFNDKACTFSLNIFAFRWFLWFYRKTLLVVCALYLIFWWCKKAHISQPQSCMYTKSCGMQFYHKILPGARCNSVPIKTEWNQCIKRNNDLANCLYDICSTLFICVSAKTG